MNGRRYTSGRPTEGSVIYVPAYGTCEVLAHVDPSLVALRTSTGAVLRVGERALRRMLDQAAEAER